MMIKNQTKQTKKIFVGVAWPYVNGNIHIGHVAGYLLPADIFSRFHRLIGDDVLMASGSDCFGTPITIQADREGKTPQQIVGTYHPQNVSLFNKLNLSFDIYTKTTSKNHQQITQDFIKVFWKKKLITIKKQPQYFDKKENKFLPDRYVEGVCPGCRVKDSRSDQCEKCGRLHNQDLINPISKLTGNDVNLKETEHLFIEWEKLEDKIQKFINEKSPEWRKWVRKETQAWLDKGLQARAVTRDLDWGVKIPSLIAKKLTNSNQKRVYVWFDAVIGYFSASVEWAKQNNKQWQDFWYGRAKHYYFMGKDNLIFHTIFWPGQLMVYDPKLILPTNPLINQFLNLEEQKFSKSRGHIIDTSDFIDIFSADSLRFYLSAIMPENSDSNFTWSDFLMKNNDILVGQIGNYFNRTSSIYKGIKKIDINLSDLVSEKCLTHYIKSYNHLVKGEFKLHIENVLFLAKFANQYFDYNKPWKLKRDNNPDFVRLSGDFIGLALVIALLLLPIMPDSIEKYFNQLKIQGSINWPNSDDLIDEIKQILQKVSINNPQPLYQKYSQNEIEKLSSI